MYSYELRTEDATGQHLTWIIPNIKVDRQPTPILIETERIALSPINDGVFDNIKLDLFTAVDKALPAIVRNNDNLFVVFLTTLF